MVPTIVGLGGAHYLIDHHHLARALYESGVASVFVTVVADLSRLDRRPFLEHDGFPWLDASVRRPRAAAPFSDLPRTVKSMEDDPYRSLAGELRAIGGFAKNSTPFSEFLWADFLRPRIKLKAIKADFNAALARALALSKTPDADYLPGWCGPKGYIQEHPVAAKGKKVKPKRAAVGSRRPGPCGLSVASLKSCIRAGCRDAGQALQLRGRCPGP